MPLQLVTPPALEPITLEEAKAHLKQDSSADDALITTLISAARARVEWHLGRALITQSWIFWLDRWPSTDCAEIPLPPSQAVTTVTLYKSDGTQVTLGASFYQLDTASHPARLHFLTKPAHILRPLNAIAIAVTAGYGDTAADVPAPLRAAILDIIAAHYIHRGESTGDVPPTALALMAPYRLVKL